MDNNLKSAETTRANLTKKLEDKINHNLSTNRSTISQEPAHANKLVDLSTNKLFSDISTILTSVMDQFGKSKFFVKFSQDDKFFRDKQTEYKYTIDFVNTLAKLISLAKT